jgi:hypothetical protein
MKITLEISEERASRYQSVADASGLTIDQWLLNIADQTAPIRSIVHLQTTDPDEWARQFRLLIESRGFDVPVLSDEAMSRDSIYPDRA